MAQDKKKPMVVMQKALGEKATKEWKEVETKYKNPGSTQRDWAKEFDDSIRIGNKRIKSSDVDTVEKLEAQVKSLGASQQITRYILLEGNQHGFLKTAENAIAMKVGTPGEITPVTGKNSFRFERMDDGQVKFTETFEIESLKVNHISNGKVIKQEEQKGKLGRSIAKVTCTSYISVEEGKVKHEFKPEDLKVSHRSEKSKSLFQDEEGKVESLLDQITSSIKETLSSVCARFNSFKPDLSFKKIFGGKKGEQQTHNPNAFPNATPI